MDEIQYVGESLLPGKIGQLFVVLSFGMALLSAISYFFSTTGDGPEGSWRKIARWSFRIHSVALVGIGAILFHLILNHHYEYHYVWSHASRELPTHYIIACFWEGQEGSFLLWGFWQAVIGNILIRVAKKWEDGVMTFVALSQAFIASMLIGVEILGQRVGSSPFILLREAMSGPIFQRADYLSFISDGQGLNPLLQNYWMVIHPPTLFAGFALMVVPFAYALAGMWTRRYAEWVRHALPWGLMAVLVLGAGIIMGSFWAYEALNFGGFWAWDPVENASLIPWVIMIAAVHVMVVYKNTGHAYATALILTSVGYMLVLYASFLTRSGILGDASVHSFTDLGMSGQLLAYLFFFIVAGAALMIKHWKQLPINAKEEQLYSREFWLFIGTLVLVISCFQIIIVTSIPVANALFGTDMAPPTDVIKTYNTLQLPIALVIGLLSGFSQFLKYKRTDSKKFFKKLWIVLGITVLVAAGIIWVTKVYENLGYILLVFACTFTVLANGDVLLKVFRGRIKLAGSAVAHMGFGIMIIGALVAASKNRVISQSNYGTDYSNGQFSKKELRENIILFKDQPVEMGDYTLTYLDDSVSGPNTYYRVNYKRHDKKTGEIKEDFNLVSNVQINEKMGGLIPNPATRHYLLHDVYTLISMVSVKEKDEDHLGHEEDGEYDKRETFTLSLGDTVDFEGIRLVAAGLKRDVGLKNIKLEQNDVAVALQLLVNDGKRDYEAAPVFMVKNNNIYDMGAKIDELGLKFRFTKIIPEKDQFELTVLQKPAGIGDWIVMKAIVFPYINLLWAGAVIMTIGFIMAVVRRSKESRLASR